MAVTSREMKACIPNRLVTCEQSRKIDKNIIESGIAPGAVLMKRAGRAAFQELLAEWPGVRKVVVMCGAGNNAGDGFVVAALARQKGMSVSLLALHTEAQLRKKLSEDATLAFEFCLAEGCELETLDEYKNSDTHPGQTVLVDALLGTGFSGQLRAEYAQAIEYLNNLSLPTIAIDIPSGLNGDTGLASEPCVKAKVTVTFLSLKQGLFTGDAPEVCGRIAFSDLGIPEDQRRLRQEEGDVACSLAMWAQSRAALKPRPRCSHKGNFGHVMVIGGDIGYGGAVAMAAEACLRAGAGLVSVATRECHVSAVLTRTPEVMVRAVNSGQELEPLLEKPSVILIGPGLGQSPWSEQMLQQVLKTSVPLVLDADALNLMANGKLRLSNANDVVITPHPGEAARLLGRDIPEVQADRFDTALRLSKKFASTVLLKGAGTLITDGQGIKVSTPGNPALAVGGAGDVLGGVLAALIAQGLSGTDAATLAAYAHGVAADNLSAKYYGEVGLRASDLIPEIRQVLNKFDGSFEQAQNQK